MITDSEIKLTSSLTDAIEKWLEGVVDGDEWLGAAGCSGPHVASVMARAALLPLFYSGDSQRYAIEQGFLSDS